MPDDVGSDAQSPRNGQQSPRSRSRPGSSDSPRAASPATAAAPTDRSGWLEMKTKLGWSPRWFVFTPASCSLARQHDIADRLSRKVCQLKNAIVRVEDGHSIARYIEISCALDTGGEEHTLRLRARGEGPGSQQDAAVWVRAIQTAQKLLQEQGKSQNSYFRNATRNFRDFTVERKDGCKIGMSLQGARIMEVVGGGPAALAGLEPDMTIVKVGGVRVGRADAYDKLAAAPPVCQIRVSLPASHYSVVGAGLIGRARLAAVALARAGLRDPARKLNPRLLVTIAQFASDLCRIRVMLWGWGHDVETKRMEVPPDSTATDVHQRLDRDAAWLNAREGGCTWDTKAVYFAGADRGPTAGRQLRVFPDDHLSAKCIGQESPGGRTIALHIVSVAAKRHLEQFSTAAQRPDDGPADHSRYDDPMQSRRDSGLRLPGFKFGGSPAGTVPYEQFRDEIAKRDREIDRLTLLVAELRGKLGGVESADMPWDEEPTAVAALRSQVEQAKSLKEIEEVEVNDAGFFTPEGTPTTSEPGEWRPTGSEGDGEPSEPPPAAAAADPPPSDLPWTGPPDAPLAGSASKVKTVPRCPLERMDADSACDGRAQSWQLRCGPNYARTGLKVPSLDSLYSFHGADVCRSDDPLENVSTMIRLPPVPHDCAGLPPVVVFNLQVPWQEAPSVWSQPLGGPTVNCVLVFVCKESTAEALRLADEGGEPCPGASLLREYANRVPLGKRMTLKEESFLGRFKLLVRADAGVPKLFARYNGKPVLVTNSGRYFRTPQCLEVDCNLRAWAYPARQAVYSMWGSLGRYRVHVGVCVEAREDPEMNERILGCAQLSEVDFEKAALFPQRP